MRKEEQNSKKISYIRQLFAPEDSALASVGENLVPEERKMQIGSDEGKILYMLAKMVAAKKIVELGVLAGYSAIWMARALPEKGKLYAVEKNSLRAEVAGENFKKCGVADKIEIFGGRGALDVLPELEDKGPFDMVFIDADKGNYLNYLKWAENNVRKGGLIIGDNAFLFGSVYEDISRDVSQNNIDVMKEFNRYLADSDRFESIMLPTAEGMVVGIKK